MNSSWERLIERLIRESEAEDALKKLLRRVADMHGEHEADVLRAKLRDTPLGDVKKLISTRYLDKKTDHFADQVVGSFRGTASNVAPPVEPSKDEPKIGTKKDGPSDRPDPRKPWAAPLGNKIKGLPTSLPQASHDDDFAEEEPTDQDMDPMSLMPGADQSPRRSVDRFGKQGHYAVGKELPRQDVGGPSGFSDPAQIKGTKSQQASVAGAERAQEKQSAVVDLQKRLWHFAQKYGPDSPNGQGTARTDSERATAQALVDRMAKQYGVPVPETDKNGRPKIKTADQLMRRDPTVAPGKRTPMAVHKPSFRGNYVGQVWRPNGVSREETNWFANLATGQMTRSKRETSPRLEGDEVVWDGSEWTPANLWIHKVKSGDVQSRSTKTDVPTNAGSLPYSWAKRRTARLD